MPPLLTGQEQPVDQFTSEIDKDSISTVHQDFPEIEAKVDFWRTASDGNFDSCRWDASEQDSWLLRYEYESAHSYKDRCLLSNDFAFAQLIVEAYTGHFERGKITFEVDGLAENVVDKMKINFDGSKNSLNLFVANIFIETLITGKTSILTDKDSDDLPYTYIIPREDIMDWAMRRDAFKFIKWKSVVEEVRGISKHTHQVIWFVTENEIGRAIKRDKDWVIDFLEPNLLGYVPAHDVWSGNEGVPIISSISKLQYNIFNLDSEWRSILRNQGGLNILALPEGVDISMLTSKTMIKVPNESSFAGAWINYPSNGLEAHARYDERVRKSIQEFSRLRKIVGGANESGRAREMDFLETEAVLNMLSSEIEKAITNAVMDWGALLGQDLTGRINFTIDRQSFRIEDLNAKLDAILKLKALFLPKTAENAAIKKFIADTIPLSDDEKEDVKKELEEDIELTLSSQIVEDVNNAPKESEEPGT